MVSWMRLSLQENLRPPTLWWTPLKARDPPPVRVLPPAPTTLDSITASYYEPVHAEDFATRRRRLSQQETMSLFGPARPRPPDQQDGPSTSTRPSTTPPAAVQPASSEVPVPPVDMEMNQLMEEALTVMDLDPDGLPEGWYVDEHGYFQTVATPSDWWEVKSGCLIKHHVVPRRNLYVARKDPKCLVDLDCLDRIRVTMMKDAPGNYLTVTDGGTDTFQDYTNNAWTGVTIFQINGKTRKEMAMVVRQPNRSATQVAKTLQSQAKRKATSASTLSERNMSLEERQAFQQAKIKEWQSFFLQRILASEESGASSCHLEKSRLPHLEVWCRKKELVNCTDRWLSGKKMYH